MEPLGLIDIIHHLFNFISIRIRSVAKEMPIFKGLLGNFLIFTTFPPEDSLGLFVCYEGHIQDVNTAEIVFVAICSRSYKMPVQASPWPANLAFGTLALSADVMLINTQPCPACMAVRAPSRCRVYLSLAADWDLEMGGGHMYISI